MKLLNYTSSWFALILFLILLGWAAIFYFDMLNEIYDSMDDGLENQKLLVIEQAARDSTVLKKDQFEDGYYKIREVSFGQVKDFTDTYQDTLMYTRNEEDFEPFRMLKTAFQHNGRYYEMRLITSMVEEDDLIEDLLIALILLYAGLMASILVLNNFMLKKIWKPFYLLLDRLKIFKLDDPKPVEVPQTKINEFALLNDAVQKLLQSNIQTYTSQKQFIENASHELQTPLAISLNKLELLVENHSLKEEELYVISGVMDNLERLSRMNKSLLLLSKINNKQFTDEAEINFNTLLQKVLNDFSDLASHRNISLSLQETEICRQKMNPELAIMLLNNLVKNAIVHNHSGGMVYIEVNRNSLVVKNSGQPNPLDATKIFERFHKGNSTGNSTGLGLAIAKAISDLYGFTIHYEFQELHKLSINFP